MRLDAFAMNVKYQIKRKKSVNLKNNFFQNIFPFLGTFINVFNKDQLTQIILNEGSAGIRVVEKFLGILQFVVKESDISFRKFIDSTLSLCLDYIYPLVADVSFVENT